MMILMKFDGKYAICNDIHMLPSIAFWAHHTFQEARRKDEVFFTNNPIIIYCTIINMNED